MKLCLLIAALLGAIYFQTFNAGFLPWDDDYNITLNLFYKIGVWTDLWTQIYYGMYIPITSSVWGVLYKVFNASPLPFRILNFTLHFLNTVLLYYFLTWWTQRLKIKEPWLIWCALALFAFHPLQVETVAWISGGRDMLSTLFALLAMIVYFKLQGMRGFFWGGLLFVASLLSKPQVASLPLIILLLQIILDRSQFKKTAAQMFIWTLPVLGIAALTFNEQKEVMLKPIEIWQRLLVIVDSLGFYWMKLIAPFSLAVDYGRTPQFLMQHLSSELLPISLFLVLAAGFGFLYFKKKNIVSPILFLAWIVCMLPVSGLIDFAYQEISTTADHYIYFSLAFLSLLFIQILSKFNIKRISAFVGISFLCLFWIGLSWQRTYIWLEPQTFFEDMLRGNPHSYSAMIGLGGYESSVQNHAASLFYFQKALLERPNDLVANTNIASALGFLERYMEVAKMEYLIFEPSFLKSLDKRHIATASLLTSLGAASFFLKQIDISILYFCQSQVINPHNKEIVNNVDIVLKSYQKDYPGATCPRFASNQDFLATAAAIKLSGRSLKQ